MSFLDFVLLVPSLLISLAILVPLTGVLIRFRANYNPKGLQLDAEGGAQAHTGPVIRSYFGMMKRVYQLEGWNGLYKGLMPTLISTGFVSVLIITLMDTKPRHGAYKSPEAGAIGTLIYSIGMMLIALPSSIITYRAITTPHKLPYFNPVVSLRILLTPTERRRPWILYLTPGLLATETSHIALVVLIFGPIARSLLPPVPAPGEPIPDVSTFKIAIYFILVVLMTAILTPLEVMGTRLAIQRNHASAGYNSVSQEVEGDDDDLLEYAGAEEDVIGLRNEDDPYTGLVDCAKRIIDEEGWQALYRAWWLTFLGTIAGGISY